MLPKIPSAKTVGLSLPPTPQAVTGKLGPITPKMPTLGAPTPGVKAPKPTPGVMGVKTTPSPVKTSSLLDRVTKALPKGPRAVTLPKTEITRKDKARMEALVKKLSSVTDL